ncbi:hypothetical protein TRFO_20459 [Tritrichomonas foetus]|uniref:Uncharacterized protein n=1 Tax=Tritrichomonas foetus TaxID=1144522 RepID=A0A1J4KKJ0_9EUKA|nr:hypothetical protein TRFO_20459 [Tritrichomonas foetus]|eukprot:OHT10324.1 hypothetical protein TRFO_20459 [Tritrichomonas foetus]
MDETKQEPSIQDLRQDIAYLRLKNKILISQLKKYDQWRHEVIKSTNFHFDVSVEYENSDDEENVDLNNEPKNSAKTFEDHNKKEIQNEFWPSIFPQTNSNQTAESPRKEISPLPSPNFNLLSPNKSPKTTESKEQGSITPVGQMSPSALRKMELEKELEDVAKTFELSTSSDSSSATPMRPSPRRKFPL